MSKKESLLEKYLKNWKLKPRCSLCIKQEVNPREPGKDISNTHPPQKGLRLVARNASPNPEYAAAHASNLIELYCAECYFLSLCQPQPEVLTYNGAFFASIRPDHQANSQNEIEKTYEEQLQIDFSERSRRLNKAFRLFD